MPWPPRGPVPTSTSLRTSSGACKAISCATKPPMEKPSTSTVFSPSVLMKATALAPIRSTVVGTSPELLEMPALLNRMTSRSLAKPSVTAGSQWSMVPDAVRLAEATIGEADAVGLHEPRRRGLVGMNDLWAAMNHHVRALIVQPAPHRAGAPGLLSRNRCRSALWVPRSPQSLRQFLRPL